MLVGEHFIELFNNKVFYDFNEKQLVREILQQKMVKVGVLLYKI